MISAGLRNDLDPGNWFCFACGNPAEQEGECRCGAPIGYLEWEPSIIGSVYRLSGLGKKIGVVVAEGEKVTLVTKPAQTTEVSRKKLDKSECIIDMSSVASELFRLRSIADRKEEWAEGVAKWLQQSDVVESWLSSRTSKRLYARSAVAAGRPDLAKESGLPTSELTWLEMHAAAAAGAHSRAVEAALTLPPSAFPDKSSVLLSSVVAGSWEPTREESQQIDKWPRWSIETLALRAALGLGLSLEEWEQVMAWLPALSSVEDRHWMELIIAGVPGQALSDRDQNTLARVVAGTRSVTLAERTVAAGLGADLSVDQQDIAVMASIAPSVLDDLVDRGCLQVSGPSDLLDLELRGRVAPGDLSTSDLEALEHRWELARRLYNDGARGNWPAGPAAEHYRALLALRAGDASSLHLLEDDSGMAAAVANAIDSGSLDPKIMSDSTTWEIVERHVDLSEGLRHVEAAGPYFLRKACSALLSWNWEGADDYAKQALKASNYEVVRDEALNMIAFLLYQSHEDESAITALERALDGDYTAALQSNAGIVAEHLAPEKAAYQLGRLAAEAPDLDLKLVAARRAFRIWNTSRLAWEDDSDLPSVPEELLTAVRELATADIDLKDFAEVMRLIANFDQDWLADDSNTAASRHSGSWERRVYVAKSGGNPELYIEEVAAGLNAGYEADWIVSERDSMVDGLRGLIFEDIENVGPATYAFIAIDKGLPMSDWNRVVLSCGALVSICRSLVSQEGLPSDQVVQMFEDAKRSVSDLNNDEKGQIEGLIAIAGNALAHAMAAGREELLRQGYQALGSMISQLEGVPLRRINWAKVAEAFRPVRDMADDSIRDLNKAKTFVSEDALGDAIGEVLEGFQQLRSIAANPRSAFS